MPTKIILLEDVPALGRRGEVRDVADGYARNYLLPQKLALHASAANLKNLEGIKARQESRAAKTLAEAQTLARTIEALHLALARQASDEDRLFGSVGRNDIAAFLTQHGVEVERRRIALDEPIKTLGEFTVPIRLHPEVTAQFKVTVTRE
jgi:large subunit ribosomal protein L9